MRRVKADELCLKTNLWLKKSSQLLAWPQNFLDRDLIMFIAVLIEEISVTVRSKERCLQRKMKPTLRLGFLQLVLESLG